MGGTCACGGGCVGVLEDWKDVAPTRHAEDGLLSCTTLPPSLYFIAYARWFCEIQAKTTVSSCQVLRTWHSPLLAGMGACAFAFPTMYSLVSRVVAAFQKVRTPGEIYGLMERGGQLRATGATRMNDTSSRSHAVFIIIVEQVALIRLCAPDRRRLSCRNGSHPRSATRPCAP